MSHEQLFWAMFGIATVSIIYPWDPSWPYARKLVHLPWLTLPIWAAYEWMMPNTMNIRMDLLLIWVGIVAVFVNYAVRLLLFYWWLPKSKA